MCTSARHRHLPNTTCLALQANTRCCNAERQRFGADLSVRAARSMLYEKDVPDALSAVRPTIVAISRQQSSPPFSAPRQALFSQEPLCRLSS